MNKEEIYEKTAKEYYESGVDEIQEKAHHLTLKDLGLQKKGSQNYTRYLTRISLSIRTVMCR